MKRVGIKDSFIGERWTELPGSAFEIQYTPNPGLCSGGWGIRGWRPCQCRNIAGEGCTLLNWWRRWEIWGFSGMLHTQPVLFFFLKAFNESWIENLEDFLQRRDSLPRRFRLEWALEPLCCCLSVTCPGTFGGTFPGKSLRRVQTVDVWYLQYLFRKLYGCFQK